MESIDMRTGAGRPNRKAQWSILAAFFYFFEKFLLLAIVRIFKILGSSIF
jgi:hypothetical protein